jgi:hypothetical protein
MYRIKLTQKELEHIIDVLWDVDKSRWSKESRQLNRNLDEKLNEEFHRQRQRNKPETRRNLAFTKTPYGVCLDLYDSNGKFIASGKDWEYFATIKEAERYIEDFGYSNPSFTTNFTTSHSDED